MKTKLSIIICSLFIFSCSTYVVTPDNFKKQLTENNSNQMKEVKLKNPINQLLTIKYQANSLKYINVYDKKGTLKFIQNSPAIEMRVTLKNGKRKIFYLDTVTLENDTLKGSKSKILNLKNQVPFDEVVKIEIQDGGKKYEYR